MASRPATEFGQKSETRFWDLKAVSKNRGQFGHPLLLSSSLQNLRIKRSALVASGMGQPACASLLFHPLDQFPFHGCRPVPRKRMPCECHFRVPHLGKSGHNFASVFGPQGTKKWGQIPASKTGPFLRFVFVSFSRGEFPGPESGPCFGDRRFAKLGQKVWLFLLSSSADWLASGAVQLSAKSGKLKNLDAPLQ